MNPASGAIVRVWGVLANVLTVKSRRLELSPNTCRATYGGWGTLESDLTSPSFSALVCIINIMCVS